MDEVNNPLGSVPPTGGPDKVNPMSPNFMGSIPGPEVPLVPPMPNNPPIGETPSAFVPPPLPPSPSVTPVINPPVSPPPPKQVDIRTMASDQSSFRASGGMGVAPQTVKSMGKVPKKVDSAGRPVGGDKKRALLIGLGIVVFLAAAAAVANFFVLPIFLPDVELSEPQAVTTDESAEEPEITPTIPTFTHTSYFTEPVDVSAEVNVNPLSLEGLSLALDQAAANKADGELGAVTEFQVTQGLTGSPITTDEFLITLLPDVQFTAAMEEDFTGFMYDTGTEVRAGYIFALDSETVDLEAAKILFEDTFEASTSLENLFLNDPGTPAVAFKDGAAVTGVETRWLAYSNPGTSIDYGWKGPFVIISTSFDGFKKVVPKVMDALPLAETTDTETAEDTATTTET